MLVVLHGRHVFVAGTNAALHNYQHTVNLPTSGTGYAKSQHVQSGDPLAAAVPCLGRQFKILARRLAITAAAAPAKEQCALGMLAALLATSKTGALLTG